MGLYDCIRCKYPLPLPEFQDYEFQTKDTPAQALDNYEIREDGTLWYHNYEIEDRSDPNATGLARIMGMCTKVNERWEPCNFLGEIRFYSFIDKEGMEGWVEFSAYFVGGKLNQIHVARYKEPQ